MKRRGAENRISTYRRQGVVGERKGTEEVELLGVHLLYWETMWRGGRKGRRAGC